MAGGVLGALSSSLAQSRWMSVLRGPYLIEEFGSEGDPELGGNERQPPLAVSAASIEFLHSLQAFVEFRPLMHQIPAGLDLHKSS